MNVLNQGIEKNTIQTGTEDPKKLRFQVKDGKFPIKRALAVRKIRSKSQFKFSFSALIFTNKFNRI